jgi:anion-transporting  ArsA/GET3 family ATPase
MSFRSNLFRNLVFVHGKGGVGKTVVSQAIAHSLASRGNSTLWITLEDPTRPAGELRILGPHLVHLNCDFSLSFDEYVGLKIGVPRLTRLFLQNKLIQYLAKAAPGIHELVLLGKIWHERAHYSHVVIDMPSTGYGLAMFQCTENFARLFRGGPLNRDAEAMLATFANVSETGHLIVSLPEETPLRESLELRDFLVKLFPSNPPFYLVNRKFPKLEARLSKGELDRANEFLSESPEQWKSPIAESAEDYVTKRALLEEYNLRLWRSENIIFKEIEFIPPPSEEGQTYLVKEIEKQINGGETM